MIQYKTISDEELPLIAVPVQPSGVGKSVKALTNWIDENLDSVKDKLYQSGAILFRGFSFEEPGDFEKFSNSFCSELIHYVGGNSPRSLVSGNVYTSTEYEKNVKISLHNEASYLKKIPSFIFFYGAIAPNDRGQTPLLDSRKLLQRIDPAIRQRFENKSLKYVSNLHGGFGFGRSWQDTYQTKDKGEVEKIMKQNGYTYSWKTGDTLHTESKCPAVRTHPITQERVWNNQAELWHPSSMNEKTRQALCCLYKPEELPKNVFYGDDTFIDEEDLINIREAMAVEEKTFQWQTGDVLVCDNYLVAHGRQAFTGERKILVAMGCT